jgi:phospholipase/carboxylesterase
MADESDQLLTAITDLIPKLLMAMEAFEQLQRNMNPSALDTLAEFISPFEQALRESFAVFKQLPFPDDLKGYGETITHSCDYSLRAMAPFVATDQANDGSERMLASMKAMRAHCRAQEYIYPLASLMSPVNKFFVEASARGNTALLQQFQGQEVAPKETRKHGIFSFSNDRKERGGFTLYVPENLDLTKPASLVIALHGGTGHGADFLWSWLREARTRGFILMSATSLSDTWSLMDLYNDIDYLPLLKNIEHVKSEWIIDDNHILLGGMSDGATYTMLAGLTEDAPFTHLAPFSGVLHPEIPASPKILQAKDKPIYLVHGTEDWMFPIETAYMAKHELENAGAKLNFREIPGLAHSYARFENPALLEWFNPQLSVPNNA